MAASLVGLMKEKPMTRTDLIRELQSHSVAEEPEVLFCVPELDEACLTVYDVRLETDHDTGRPFLRVYLEDETPT